jgi:hypothetical protein
MVGGLYWWHYQAKAAPLAVVVHADEAQVRKKVALPPAKVTSSEDLSTLRRNLAAVDQPASATAAFNGLAALWGAEPLPADQQISDVAGFVKAFNSASVNTPTVNFNSDKPQFASTSELTLPGVGYRYLSHSVSGSGSPFQRRAADLIFRFPSCKASGRGMLTCPGQII